LFSYLLAQVLMAGGLCAQSGIAFVFGLCDQHLLLFAMTPVSPHGDGSVQVSQLYQSSFERNAKDTVSGTCQLLTTVHRLVSMILSGTIFHHIDWESFRVLSEPQEFFDQSAPKTPHDCIRCARQSSDSVPTLSSSSTPLLRSTDGPGSSSSSSSSATAASSSVNQTPDVALPHATGTGSSLGTQSTGMNASFASGVSESSIGSSRSPISMHSISLNLARACFPSHARQLESDEAWLDRLNLDFPDLSSVADEDIDDITNLTTAGPLSTPIIPTAASDSSPPSTTSSSGSPVDSLDSSPTGSAAAALDSDLLSSPSALSAVSIASTSTLLSPASPSDISDTSSARCLLDEMSPEPSHSDSFLNSPTSIKIDQVSTWSSPSSSEPVMSQLVVAVKSAVDLSCSELPLPSTVLASSPTSPHPSSTESSTSPDMSLTTHLGTPLVLDSVASSVQ
jgi:hypothetical protein